MNRSDKINVLHLIATNFIGGPEKQIIKHLEYVDKDRYNISVCSFIEKDQPNQLLEKLSELNHKTYRIQHNFLFDLSIISRLKEILTEAKTDILITHGYKSNIIGHYASGKLKIPQAMYVRGWTSENWRMKLYNKIEVGYLKKAKLVVTVANNKLAELISLDLNEKKLRCITNAVELPKATLSNKTALRNKYNLSGNTLLILAAGRLSPEKGHRQLILALDKLKNDSVDFCCVIFGDGQLMNELKELTTKLNLDKKLIFAGFNKNWKDNLAEADVVINPSLSEVMPNVVLESMAARIPVIATDVGGVSELISDGKTGFLADPGDPQSLYTAIQNFIAGRGSIEQLVEKGYQHIAENFSFDRQAKKLHNLYDELLNMKEK